MAYTETEIAYSDITDIDHTVWCFLCEVTYVFVCPACGGRLCVTCNDGCPECDRNIDWSR